MRTRLSLLFVGFFGLMFGFSSSYGITIQVPSQQGQTDVAVLWSTSIQENESTLLNVIQLINSYLWFAIWVVCMAVLIRGWVKLITAQWDEKKMAEANKLLLWALAWIIISLLSYALIRLIVNLF
jgi:hypothetical protein